MFRELKLSITDGESHLKMRLDALLSDVMTACWRATLATVIASLGCAPPVRVEAEEQESPLLGCLWLCLQRPEGFTPGVNAHVL
jgi:hypothetical protein